MFYQGGSKMPNRILKESICTSDTVDELSWFEEAFFYRLIVNCDDYGRFDARSKILKARLFPLKDITVDQVSNALNKLSKVGMVQVYEYDHRPYLQLVTWSKHQTVRNKRSKYPDPAEGCKQLNSIASKCPRNPIQSESESESESNSAADAAQCDDSIPAEKSSDGEKTAEDEGAQPKKKVGKDGYTQDFETFWFQYPRKLEKKKAFRAWKTRVKEGVKPDDLIQACANYAAYCEAQGTSEKYVKHGSTFLGPDKPYEEYIQGMPETPDRASQNEPKSWGVLRKMYVSIPY
ncbi:MAG TPA: hypothetical protein DDW62_12310, partial [Marinilabiliaceae bacterium]|nr:hypothetical protein [Marinilabiliaceae bacterium]